MTAPASYLSTPVLSLAGQTSTAIANDLLSITVTESIVGMCSCEARFVNYGIRNNVADYLYLARDVFDFGKAFAVTLGAGAQARKVFDGAISAIQADYPLGEEAQVLIFAEDSLQKMRMTRRTRTFDDASTTDIAGQLASEYGLTTSFDVDSVSRTVTAQVNQSDLAFLRMLARRDDAEVWVEDGVLHLSSRPSRDGGTLSLSYGAELSSFSVRADLADQATDVVVAGWDVSGKDAISETGDGSALGSELAPGDTGGSDVLATAFSARHERIVATTPLASDEARALARAAYLERARRFACGTGMTCGTAQIRVGARLNLSGLGALFNGSYYVTRTRHMFDLTLGYRTEFDVERAGIGSAS
jgi:phage protein D